MKCEYCGNGSGKTDMRGNCKSCGAPIKHVTRVDVAEMSVPDPNNYGRDIIICSTDVSMDLGRWESSLPETIRRIYSKRYSEYSNGAWFGGK